MRKQFTLHLLWGDDKRHVKVNNMLLRGYCIVHHWEPQIIGESHVYVFVKD